ncbi:hypothetical protein O6V14_02860 [Sphingomonas faeni]|uniref:hypothetical protein n=1 Tax=Sphingomonas faeni TaxID=185950 RepID=UPI003358945C
MQDPDQQCAICRGKDGALCRTFGLGSRDALGLSCQACGDYEVTRTARITWLDNHRLNIRERAALSHLIRNMNRDSGRPLLDTHWLEHFISEARLPNPANQAINLIRVIGDYQAETGEGYFIDGVCDATLVGSFNQTMFDQLLAELTKKQLVVHSGENVTITNPRGNGVLSGRRTVLTLDGWERYESERRGKENGSYGFIAMKFSDPQLEALVSGHIKPGLKETLNIDIVDLRNVSRAGVIDNILREQIRDASFVLVDLTHDNSGAYWEAGYAEGLGKPVIYLCERTKFDTAKTHFDTNHCTTVIWTVGDEAAFVAELSATIRRSLSLFK